MSHHLATPERPNILLITTDQQRFDAMRINNPQTPLRTPHMDGLASRGVNFTRAYTTCPVCIPARRTLLTGLHPTTHGLTKYQDGKPWEPPFTVPGLVREAGYQTQLVGKLHQWPQRKRFGFDDMILSDSPNHRPTSDFHPHNDYTDWLQQVDPHAEPNNHGVNGNSRVARPFNLDENRHQTSWLADQAIDFLTRRRDPSMPWFLHLLFWAPHPPLVPPQAYWDFTRSTTRFRPPASGRRCSKNAARSGTCRTRRSDRSTRSRCSGR
jgi:arylsulfatase A-like enzyme